MNNNNLEIGSAIYVGTCIYNKLRKSIVQIENEFVSLEDKRELCLYLGILNSKNGISSLLNETELVKGTKIDYKKLDSKEFCVLYDLYLKDIVDDINIETIHSYFKELLTKDIVIKLNREYNFNVQEFISVSNKQLVKK